MRWDNDCAVMAAQPATLTDALITGLMGAAVAPDGL